jgi:hypothetical protein
MPPAFNLSQDQTLQFDLDKNTQNGIEVNLDALIAERPLRNTLSNALVLHLLSSVSVWDLNIAFQLCSRALAFAVLALAIKRPRLSAVYC